MPPTSADTSWLASARATADASRRINRPDLLDRGDKAHHLRHPAYGASKAAVDGVCRYVGKEAAPRGVRVNVVMPGLIDTALGRLASQARPTATLPLPPRPPRQRLGYRPRRHLPALRRSQLRHRTNPRHRRRTHRARLTRQRRARRREQTRAAMVRVATAPGVRRWPSGPTSAKGEHHDEDEHGHDQAGASEQPRPLLDPELRLRAVPAVASLRRRAHPVVFVVHAASLSRPRPVGRRGRSSPSPALSPSRRLGQVLCSSSGRSRTRWD